MTLKPFNLLYLGSDLFSVGCLSALLPRKHLWNSIHVVTPPSQRIGRKKTELYEPPLRKFAEAHSLQVSTVPVEGITNWVPPDQFQTADPSNVLVTASFGHILPSHHLSLFESNRKLNVHPSLLPKYRGASPIQYAIMNQDPITGVTVQDLSEKGADTGGVYIQREWAVPPHSTFDSLVPPLADLGGELLVQTLEGLIAGTLESTPQTAVGKSRARKIPREMAMVEWERMDAEQVYARFRGIAHQQTIYTYLPPGPLLKQPTKESIPILLFDLSLPSAPISFPNQTSALESGSVFYSKLHGALVAQCATGQILIKTTQVAYKTQGDARQTWLRWKDQGRIQQGVVKFSSRPVL